MRLVIEQLFLHKLVRVVLYRAMSHTLYRFHGSLRVECRLLRVLPLQVGLGHF